MKKKEIRQKYYEYVISKKKAPATLNKFLSYAELKKKAFNSKYTSLSEVEADIWKNSLCEALDSLKESAEFASYSCKDKGLAMMYTWFEYMELNSKFFKKCDFLCNYNSIPLCQLSRFKKESKKFMKYIIKQGCENKEFKDRSIPPKYMANFFWGIFLMNIKSWKKMKGKKANKEEWMDAMIEKSMVFFFDTLAPNLFDAFFDMLKHNRSRK